MPENLPSAYAAILVFGGAVMSYLPSIEFL